MDTIYLRTRDGFETIDGYNINKEFCCYEVKVLKRWILTDTATGCSTGDVFNTLTECKKFVRDNDFTALKEKRKHPKYMQAVADLREFKNKNNIKDVQENIVKEESLW